MKGLYIMKCYWAYSRAPKKIFPVLKYGMTGNLNTRKKYYDRIGSYKLLAFFPCNDIKFRESLVHKERESYRLTGSEHEIYYKGLFKELYKEVKYAANMEIYTHKEKDGTVWKHVGNMIYVDDTKKEKPRKTRKSINSKID
jgi:hypothetical protein